MGTTAPVIMWFRQDLRLADNPALTAAAAAGPVLPVYVLDDETSGQWRVGGASRWWLAESLTSLTLDLAKMGLPLLLRRGRADEVIEALAAETGAGAVFWNRCYEPFAIARDRRLKAGLKARDINAESFNGSLLAEPWTIETKSGTPFKVYTPFSRALMEDLHVPDPLPVPEMTPADAPAGDTIDEWGLRPTRPDWAGGLKESWQPGEAGARLRLERFLDEAVQRYKNDRNRPDKEGTSRLSPHLHFGETSPQQAWRAARYRMDQAGDSNSGGFTFLKELVWREFSHNLLYHFPDLPESPLRPEFARFGWADDEEALAAWQRGRTGYPIVDAGMRQLWHSGWMHNRVRMLAGSFLVKDLMLPWQQGEAWFWETLVDADLANNAAGWQWIAGCGTDAAPYFRIFNPVTQGEKFDPDGAYVRRWVPELARLPNDVIHRPWDASEAVLKEAGVMLGETYPHPIVDHSAARQRALDAFQDLKAA